MRKIRFNKTADIPADNYTAVKGHPDIVNCHGQIGKIFLPYFHIFFIAVFKFREKILELAVCIFCQNFRRTVHINAALFPAVTCTAPRHEHHMPELSASEVIPEKYITFMIPHMGIRFPEYYGSADTVA